MVNLRYVDDILAVLKPQSHVRFFMVRFERRSVLKVTHERIKDDFLDVSLNEASTNFSYKEYNKFLQLIVALKLIWKK